MEPKLAGRHITMMLSPLPAHLQKPKFKVHEEPPEEDDDEDEDDDEGDDEEENEVRSRPNEDHHHLEVEEEIEHLESDDGRPKLKRGS